MAQKILLYRFCLKSYNIIDFDTIFLNRSCCMCLFLFIHCLWLSLPWNSPSSSRENGTSCTFRSPSSLSMLSLYWNTIFIKSSFHNVLSKPQHVKLLHKRKLETISRVSLKQPWQYSSPTSDTLAVCIDEWHFYTAVLFIYFLNQPTAP